MPGDPKLKALNLAIKKALEANDKASALAPEETARFRKTLLLENKLKTIETSRVAIQQRGEEEEEYSLTSELCCLVEEGEEFVGDLEEPESYVATLTKKLLQGNSSPASKLSQLSTQMREAQSSLQLHQDMAMVQRKSEEESENLQAQEEVAALAKSVSELKEIQKAPTETNDALCPRSARHCSE
jgi:hypothetical protein